MFAHSIRWRLQLWLGFLLLCVLTGFGIAVYELQKGAVFREVDEQLEARLGKLTGEMHRSHDGNFEGGGPRRDHDRERNNEMRPDPGEHRRRRGPKTADLSPETLALFAPLSTSGFYYKVWSPEGEPVLESTGIPSYAPPPDSSNDFLIRKRTREDWREAYQFTMLGECILVGRSIQAERGRMREFALFIVLAGGVVLACGLGIGWWLTTATIKPIEDISAAASRISAGNLSDRISVPDPENELGRLAEVLNTTFARLKAAFDRQKQFTGDAAHELRTPLAVIISEAQATLARERSAAEYRETVEACLQAAQEMRQLSESLLQLARLDEGLSTTVMEQIDVAAVARDCVEKLSAFAAERNVTVQMDLSPSKMRWQASRCAQIVTNLVNNAIYYNKPGGKVRVRTEITGGILYLTVEDTGRGIAKEDRAKIFERFYRVDKARSRSDGRSGLGLAICKQLVEMDGGEISVRSVLGEGSTFTVTFPVS